MAQRTRELKDSLAFLATIAPLCGHVDRSSKGHTHSAVFPTFTHIDFSILCPHRRTES